MRIQIESVKQSSRGEFQMNPFYFINIGKIMLYNKINDIFQVIRGAEFHRRTVSNCL